MCFLLRLTYIILAPANVCLFATRRFVVKAEDAMQAINVVHARALQIPTHVEQENNFIKGGDPFSHLLNSSLVIIILTFTRTLVVLSSWIAMFSTSDSFH